jgi:GNAT superfamily N-acetyltransferase
VCVAAPLGSRWGWGWGAEPAGFDDPRLGEWAVIRRLAVDRDVQGQGIGAALFAEQLRQLHRRGHARYLLHVPDDPNNLPALRLYQKFGCLVDSQQVLRVSF